jgi:hypothetical protein
MLQPQFASSPRLMDVMRAADVRLNQWIAGLAVFFIVLSVAAVPLGCTASGRLINHGLDLTSLLMFALLPVMYLSGRRALRA